MTNRQIDNRIKKLQELERQRKEIEQKENELKAEIKRDLESKDIEELQTGNFIVRWKTIISNSLDSKALKNSVSGTVRTVYETDKEQTLHDSIRQPAPPPKGGTGHNP